MCELQDDQKIEDLLTIIITTSPTPSAPFPELVQRVLASLPEALNTVPLIITFDGYSISQNKRAEGRLKRGQIPQVMADTYPTYIQNVKSLFGKTWSEEVLDPFMHAHISSCLDSGGRPVTSIRQSFRQGFGNNVKLARRHVSTPLVLVLQHDWVLTHPSPPFATLCRRMLRDDGEGDGGVRVRYVTFIARQSVRYEVSRGNKSRRNEEIMRAARQRAQRDEAECPLVPCLHFFDRPHLCCVSLYDQVFDSGLVKRGDFIEDTYGCALIDAINRAESQQDAFEVWANVGTWMYYPDEGATVAVRHTSGRTCLPLRQQEERIREYVRTNRSNQAACE